jgi:hypothetical protein
VLDPATTARPDSATTAPQTVYVSSDAWLDAVTQLGRDGLYNTRDDVDVLSGNLDRVRGALSVDAGAGRNRLFLSDESATSGDTAVTIERSGDAIAVTGLAPARMSYRIASGRGTFAGGITYWTSRFDDAVTVTARTGPTTASAPSPRSTPWAAPTRSRSPCSRAPTGSSS